MVGGIIAIIQQSKILKQDEEEMEALADEPTKKQVIEGELVRATSSKNKKSKKSSTAKKRRK